MSVRLLGFVAALGLVLATLAPPTPALAKGCKAELSETRGDLTDAFLGTLPATFNVAGTNPDGTSYAGTAQMSFNWSSFIASITWQVGADTFQGQGPLDRGCFIIDWGQADPVIYEVNADLSLSGTWAGGRASETLTPVQ